MTVIYTSRFAKDLRKISDAKLKSLVLQVIEQIKSSSDLSEIDHLIKLKGGKDAYRIRVGEYRIGLYFRDNSIILGRFADRKDIYKFFP